MAARALQGLCTDLRYHSGARELERGRRGGGVGFYFPHAEAAFDGEATSAGYQNGGLAYPLFAGLDCALARRAGPFAELKFDAGHAAVDLQGGAHEHAPAHLSRARRYFRRVLSGADHPPCGR